MSPRTTDSAKSKLILSLLFRRGAWANLAMKIVATRPTASHPTRLNFSPIGLTSFIGSAIAERESLFYHVDQTRDVVRAAIGNHNVRPLGPAEKAYRHGKRIGLRAEAHRALEGAVAIPQPDIHVAFH